MISVGSPSSSLIIRSISDTILVSNRASCIDGGLSLFFRSSIALSTQSSEFDVRFTKIALLLSAKSRKISLRIRFLSSSHLFLWYTSVLYLIFSTLAISFRGLKSINIDLAVLRSYFDFTSLIS